MLWKKWWGLAFSSAQPAATEMNIKKKISQGHLRSRSERKILLPPIGLKLGEKNPECEENIKRTLGMRFVKVIKGQGHVKCKFTPIGLKLGNYKPGREGSMKRTVRMRLVNVIRSQGQVKCKYSNTITNLRELEKYETHVCLSIFRRWSITCFSNLVSTV